VYQDAETLRVVDVPLRGVLVPTPATTGAAGPGLWHRIGQSGTLRAAIFGVSDGLVSNLALVMGVAGATTDGRMVIFAGLAGLLAGAFSMAAGEWISMTSQRELFERQVEIARERFHSRPDVQEAELAALYERKGIPGPEAGRLAACLMADPDVALDTKTREELGLDPDELGSPWAAALGSLLSFTAGAAVPLAPFFVLNGALAVIAAVVSSAVALAAVGAGVSLATGRRTVVCAVRQVAAGAAAAGVTFVVGSAVGSNVSI
jgi:VIT1/CCC1 family predicted Fe2+/Mn2+ transporter